MILPNGCYRDKNVNDTHFPLDLESTPSPILMIEYLNFSIWTKLRKTLALAAHEWQCYILTDKLTNFFFKKEEDIRPFFQSQLEDVAAEFEKN